MRTLPVRVGQEARDDLQKIEAFIALQGRPAQAADFVEAILARCAKIGGLPFGGSPRDELMQGARSVPFKRAVTIVYTVEDEWVTIQGVFYGGRDVDGHFTSE